VIEVALPLMAAKIKADPILEGALLGHGLRGGSSFLEMEKSHLQTLVGSVSFFLLAFSLLLTFAVAFTLSPTVRIGGLIGGRLGSFGSRWCGNEPPPQ
jgi:hypothetical protein